MYGKYIETEIQNLVLRLQILDSCFTTFFLPYPGRINGLLCAWI